MVEEITSLDDPRLGDYRNVPDAHLLASRGIFIAEGRLVVRRLLATPRFTTRSLLLTRPAQRDLEDLVAAHPALPVFVIDQKLMNAVVGYNIHRGCLAIGERPAPADWREIASAAQTVVVLEAVANADNVGAVFRNVAAFGGGAVLLGPTCTDPLYRKAIRTSMGAALRVPFARLPDWPAELFALRETGMATIALTPDPDAPPLAEVAQTPVARGCVALLLGHEGSGLTPEVMRAADMKARIPMAPGVDSLNVAVATAVALYELRRTQPRER